MNRNYFNVFLYGALALSTATFVGCKDYDDDIADLQTQIDKLSTNATSLSSTLESLKSSLEADLASQKSSLETQIAQAKSALQTAIDSKADAADVTALAEKVANLTTDLAAKESALQAQIDAANAAIDALKAANKDEELQAAIEEANATIAALTGKVTDLEAAAESLKAADATLAAADATLQANIDAVNKSLEIQAAALEAFQKKIEDADYQSQINDLLDQVKALGSTDEAIKAQIADLQKLVSDNNDAQSAKLATEIAALKTTIEAQIAANTAKISTNAADIAANEKKISELQAEITKLKTLLGGSDSEVAAALSVSEQLLQNTQKISDNEAAIAALKESLTKSNDNLSTLNANVNTLTLFINRALSSVTLVPELYIGGIEAIEFESLFYTAQVFNKDGKLEDKLDAKKNPITVTVSSGETTANYRLSPSAVTEDSYVASGISFVGVQASARTRGVLADADVPVEVSGTPTLGKNGLLTVNLKKKDSFTSSLNLADKDGAAQIYTVALRIPRSEKYTEEGQASEVYSEYTRLAETTFTPVIASKVKNSKGEYVVTASTAALHHYSDSTTIYEASVWDKELISIDLDYDKSFDLNNIVTGCYLDENGKHVEITAARLKKFGLEFRYHIPAAVYNTEAYNQTDQQQFASVTTDGIITSKLPDGTTEANEAVLDKQPIVCVDLVDSKNDNLVDRKYFKIRWSYEALETKDLGSYDSTEKLSCNTIVALLDWDTFVNTIYAKAAEGGISKNAFQSIYKYSELVSVERDGKALTSGYGTLNFWYYSSNDGDSHVGRWYVDPSVIGKISGSSSTLSAKIKFISNIPTKYPDLTLTWNLTVSLPAAPTIYGYYANYWIEKGKSHYILPIQYNTEGAGDRVKYNYNLTSVFTKNSKGLIIDGLDEDCGGWDLQFSLKQSIANTQVKYYDAKATEPYLDSNVDDDAYILQTVEDKVASDAVSLNFDGGEHTWFAFNGASELDAADVYFVAEPDKEANWSLINELGAVPSGSTVPAYTSTKPINISIWGKINDYNYVKVLSYDAYMVAPLRISTSLNGSFYDGIASGSKISCANAFQLIDFRGYTVQKTQAGSSEKLKYSADLYKYYGVDDPTWDTTNIRFGLKKSGNDVVVDNTLDASNAMTQADLQKLTGGDVINVSITYDDANKQLIFKNNKGTELAEPINIFIPVTMKYAFGTITEYVKIVANPAK